jgi:uncharacterized lipoprotein YmbA
MRAFLPPLLLLLAACSDTVYYAPPPLASELRVNARADNVAIVDVTMPEYAINQEIPIQQPDGGLLTDTDRLWADLPDRALTGSLVRNLNVITDAQVAAEPWPLAGFPDAEVSIFVDDMIVQANGTIRFTGTYAIGLEAGRDTGQGGTIEPFALSAPVPGPLDSYTAIIAAHEAVWIMLAEQIARDL